MYIQLTPTITDLKGPEHYICYSRIPLLPNWLYSEKNALCHVKGVDEKKIIVCSFQHLPDGRWKVTKKYIFLQFYIPFLTFKAIEPTIRVTWPHFRSMKAIFSWNSESTFSLLQEFLATFFSALMNWSSMQQTSVSVLPLSTSENPKALLLFIL